MRDGAPPMPVSSTPAVAGLPTAIARAGLGAVEEGGGTSTITFPAPDGVPEYVPFSTEPMTVSRSPWDNVSGMVESAVTDYASDAIGDARSAVTERATSAIDAATGAAHGAIDQARGALPGGARGSGAGDADKQFEELYDRLKRELMIEQEQLGQLFHEP